MKRILFFCLIAGSLIAGNAKVGLTVNKDQFYIGDRIRIDLKITAAEKQMFVLPKAEEWITGIQILNSSVDQKIKKDLKLINMKIEAVAFDTGFVRIPSMPVIATDTTGFGQPDTLYSTEKFIYISSILDSSAVPLPLNPPVPLALMTWWELLIALILLSGSATLLVLGIRHRRNKKEQIEEYWESPKEKAEHLLQELVQKHYPEKKQWKKFYLELTFIVRDYLENIYYMHLKELTTSELIPVLKENIPAEYIDRVVEFFQFADLVKFAKGVASEEQCAEHFTLAENMMQIDPANEDGEEERNS